MARRFPGGVAPDVDNMCMTRLGAELNQHIAELARAGELPHNSAAWRRPGPRFAIVYGREDRHEEVSHTVVRAYVKALREGFRRKHTDLD